MRKLIAAATLAALFPIVSAHAGNAVTISSVTRSGGTVTVAGSIDHGPVSFPTLGQEATGDDLLGGTGDVGADLLGFSMDLLSNDRLQLRWRADVLPDQNGPSPGLVYGAVFTLNGQVAYEVTMVRGRVRPPGDFGVVGADLWRCAEPDNCTSRTRVSADISSQLFGVDHVSATLDAGRVTRGDRITPLSLGQGSVYIGVGTSAEIGQSLVDDQRYYDPYANDWIDQDYASFVAGLRLEAGVAEPGQDPATVQYPTRVTLGAGDTFNVSLSAASGESIYLRACHATTCFYESVDAPA